MALSSPSTPRAADPLLEEIRRTHEDKIRELQKLPAAELRPIAGVKLKDGVATPVPHGLGRVPLFVRESCPRGAVTAGMVSEVRDGSVDRRAYVVLMATGYGADIVVDLVVL